jgi:methyl-accepting chemotaxis protein
MSDVFDMQAKLGLDYGEYKKGMNDAKSLASSVGSGIKTGLSGIANGVKVIGTAIGAAVTVAATGIGVLTKAAVKGYAEYEQLQGGVAKLYGSAGMNIEQYAQSVGKSTDEVKDKYNELQQATKIVMQNASEAYKNVGMSANEYMQIATGFSAALINSLGGDTVKAAEQTEVAMRAISDNVNTFGSDMESVTNAFQAFSKQNYTLLDNLKLGYGKLYCRIKSGLTVLLAGVHTNRCCMC